MCSEIRTMRHIMQLTSFGKYPRIQTTFIKKRTISDTVQHLEQISFNSKNTIGRGNGRSYGDSALNESSVVSCLRLNCMESFDSESGVLVAESGVLLCEILDAFVWRGWFLPVTPGTKFITLGGAIASDVHGKDHHIAGTFSQHVLWFDLWTVDRGIIRCSQSENVELFYATSGGMGLTGIILRVALKLKRIPSAWIRQETIKAQNLEEILNVFEECKDYPYSVAWIDCLKTGRDIGRSLFMGGRFDHPDHLLGQSRVRPYKIPKSHELTVPLDFPTWTLNQYSVQLFNMLYYERVNKQRKIDVVSYNSFFYPLDALHDWNRIYGKRGFTQYQFVIPKEAGREGLSKVLNVIAESGQGSFLSVLKLFGKQNTHYGSLSFPLEGYTLALDFAIHEQVFPLLDKLDSIVFDYGGRHYLTKDCRLTAESLCRGYKTKVDEFLEIKKQVDSKNVFSSLQSSRLQLKV